MQALILAAGMGKRLKELTRNGTKCMVRVNGIPLIDRALSILDSFSLSRIVIVTGYKADVLEDYIRTLAVKTEIVFVRNDIYDRTNNIYSLFLARDYLLKEDTLLLESDLVFEQSVIDRIISCESSSCVLVSKFERWMDGTCVKLSEEGEIKSFIDKKHFDFREASLYYKTVNIYKFSQDFSSRYYVPFLEAYTQALGNNEYYEQVLKVIALLDEIPLKALVLDESAKWYEIDDEQDLKIAETIFEEDQEKKMEKMAGGYGGFWRYPRILDYCYLVNPYYPPEQMKEEIKASFSTLLESYPSGQRVLDSLAAKNFSLDKDTVIVGNGAAELINILMKVSDGNYGLIIPSFEEYINRLDEQRCVLFDSSDLDYRYRAEDLISYFDDKKIDNLIIINPDNPSGNFLKKDDVLTLIGWAGRKNIRLIIDESFADFAQEDESFSLLDKSILAKSPHLVVIKSISKSYGVPGLRLGLLATADSSLMGKIRKNISIWNINSFAEFYLQIEEKYHKDYKKALKRLAEERSYMARELESIDGVAVYPSSANYLMLRLDKEDSTLLASRLLSDYEIMIKDLKAKRGFNKKNFIRLAIRRRSENERLLAAIKKILGP